MYVGLKQPRGDWERFVTRRLNLMRPPFKRKARITWILTFINVNEYIYDYC